jgi:hypothetical protein
MKFLKFLSFGKAKKEKTTEELFNKCEESFYELCSYVHLSHTPEYHQFKKQFTKDANYCITAIVECKEQNLDVLQRKLINHLQKQIDYIQDNSFGPNSRIKHREFLEANYPYQEKVNEIINKHKLEKAATLPSQTNKNIPKNKFAQSVVEPLQENAKRKLKM